MSGEYTDRMLDLVARELWWRDEPSEYPPDKERWRTAAAALPLPVFQALLREAEERDDGAA